MSRLDSDAELYMSGFGNEFESEASGYKGALPQGQSCPQKCKYNLIAEQLSGTAFTAPRTCNRRSWLYRRRPSVCHSEIVPSSSYSKMLNFEQPRTVPGQMRWKPFSSIYIGINFVEGIHTLAYSDPSGCAASSVAIHLYFADKCMTTRERESDRGLAMCNTDGDFLIVPQIGKLCITTEFGLIYVEPNEICVIQQGMRFSVDPMDDSLARGYILEVKGNHFELPNLGPIGANGLANPRDFLTPRANYDCRRVDEPYEIHIKFQNKMFVTEQDHSPYDVCAWSGNYVPYKYSLDKFVAMNTVTRDHPDPSIFTVLTCPSIGKPGTALADFVIFPPRWECANDTFRPPYYHRNCMTEFMGLIKGHYQAKSAGAFMPGGGSLHQCMMPHGPDLECYKMATSQDTSVPKRVADDTMAFMFETSLSLKLSPWAVDQNVDKDYYKCWKGLADLNVRD